MKILKSFLAVACCTMMFTACGGSDKAEQKDADSTATEQAEGAEAQKAEEPETVNPLEGKNLSKEGEELGAYRYEFTPKNHIVRITVRKELAKGVIAYSAVTAPYEADAQSITIDYEAAEVGGNLTGDNCMNYPPEKGKAQNEKVLAEKKALGKVTYTVTPDADGKKFALTSDKENITLID